MKNFDLFFRKLIDIKEAWEIYKIFENERQRFIQEKEDYQSEVQKNQEKLRQYRNEILELKTKIQDLKKQKLSYEKSLLSLQEKRVQQKIKNSIKKLTQEKDDLKEKKQEILPDALLDVEVFLDNGEIKKMKTARRIYDESLFAMYRIALKEGREFRNKIAELELENSQLKIEIRDFYTEMVLKERMQKDENFS